MSGTTTQPIATLKADPRTIACFCSGRLKLGKTAVLRSLVLGVGNTAQLTVSSPDLDARQIPNAGYNRVIAAQKKLRLVWG